MKVTYKLSTSECVSSHSSKWREEQPFILITHLVLECSPNMKVTHFLSTSECMSSCTHAAASGEKSNHSFLITHIVLKYKPNMKVTYLLSTSECMSSHSSKWREEQPFILDHTYCVEIQTKYESNLPPEHK